MLDRSFFDINDVQTCISDVRGPSIFLSYEIMREKSLIGSEWVLKTIEYSRMIVIKLVSLEHCWKKKRSQVPHGLGRWEGRVLGGRCLPKRHATVSFVASSVKKEANFYVKKILEGVVKYLSRNR